MFSRCRVEPACGAVALIALVLGCQERSVTAVDVAAVAVVPSTATVTVGATRQFEVEVRDAGGNVLNGRTVTWSVEDPTRARSEGGGLVTGLSPGPTTVRASSGGVSGTAEITVMEAVAIALSPEQVTLTLEQGAAQPATRDVTVTNANGGELAGLRATVEYASGQPSGWLTTTLSGTAAPATLTLGAAAGSLAVGTYQATVTVAAAGDASPSRTLPVSLQVTAASATIQLGSSGVSFTVAAGAPDPAPQTVQVTNGGGGSLTGLGASVTYGAGQATDWLVATLSPSNAPSTLTLAARTASLAPGTYSATVMISAAGASNSPQSLPVTLTVGAQAPAISLSETSRVFTATQGGADPPAQSVTVSNAGGGSLSGLSAAVVYPAGQGTDWLSAALTGTTAPATLTLQPRTGALPAGTYTATVEVRSDVAANSPQTIAVTFQVNAPTSPPVILLTPDTVTFTATAGAADPASRAVQVSNGGGGMLSGLAATVSYGSAQTGWLSATLSSSTAPATLTLQAAIGSLAAGTYTATVQVASSDAGVAPHNVAVTLIVGAAPVAPAISLSPTSASFTATTGGGNPGSQTVSVSNTGGGTLDNLSTAIHYTAGQPSGWLSASLSATTAPATLTLQATTGLLLPGTYTARVEVGSSAASNSPQEVAVTFQVTLPVIPPAIALSPTSLTFNATAGGANPAAQTVAVSNSGGSTLDALTTSVVYGSGQPAGWLTVTLGSTTAPTQLTVQPATGSLAAGTYNATIEVASSKASNSPQTVAITFTVAAAPTPPAIALSATAASFTGTAGGSNPSAQTVDVTNAGGGALDDLSVNVQHPSGQSGGWLNASLATNTAPTQLTLTVTTGSLPAGTYDATVEVRSNKASNSPQTIAVAFTLNPPPAATAPAAPSNLNAEPRGTTMMDLTWNDNADNETEYLVQRSLLPLLFSTIATLPANATTYRDTGLLRNTRYYYRVLACNAIGCSASNVDDARTN